ncbi:MAG: extracellular solute-binding protein [Candidatus Riflebacteria bacterium]|nr:extracellular solute-binding protein [Candidatus Riflebacteria bacterium]
MRNDIFPASRCNILLKRLICLFILLLFSILPGTSRAGTEEKILQFWAMGSEGKLIRVLADRFEKENPEAKILVQAIPWTGAHEKLVTAVVGNLAPDICQMGTTWMPEFEAMNALEPLNSRLNLKNGLSEADFFPESIKTARQNDVLYGIPWYVDTRVFYYRSDIARSAGFNKFPETWMEMYKLCSEIVKAKRQANQPGYAFSLPINDWQIFLMFFWQAGGELFPQAGRETVLSIPEFGKTLEFLKRFIDEKLAPVAAGKDMDLLAAFESGYFPMFISGPWMISEIIRNKPALEGKWTTARMPMDKKYTSFLGGCNLVMFKGSPNRDLAWKFVDFLSRPDIQADWYELSKNLPANRLAWKDARLAQNSHMHAFREQLEDAKAPPCVPEWEQIADVLSGTMEAALFGKTPSGEAAEAANRNIARLMRVQPESMGKTAIIIAASAIFLLPLIFLVIFFRTGPGDGNRSHRTPPGMVLFFLAPAIIILVVFLFIPIVASLFASLTNWNLYGLSDPSKVNFIGFDNYRRLWEDPVFWVSLKNTLLFSLLGVPLNITLSLASALLLNRKIVKFKALFRIGFFIPVITTMVAVAVIWRWLYNPEFGVFNQILKTIGLSPLNWLSDTWLALPCLIFMAVWKGFGYNMIIYIAALQGIPESLYEAAEIDGANASQQFWHITLPMLRKTSFFVAVMTTIGYLQFFAEPYIMTGGGPLNSTISVVLYMYQHAFKFYNLGYASSIAYALFVIILAMSIIQGRIQKRLEGSV